MIDAWIWLVGLFLASVAGCWLLTPLAGVIARRLGAVDRPHLRKIHKQPIPRMGGVAIVGTVYLVFGAFWAIDRLSSHPVLDEEAGRPLQLMISALPIFLLGVVDDIRGLRALVKLVVQLAVAIVLVYVPPPWGMCGEGFGFPVINLPFLGALPLGGLGSILLVFWIVGVTNAFNLMDGLDGLAAGVGGMTALAICVMGIINETEGTAVVAAILCGACLGFLRHNFHPAKIFMGDSGSLFLGFVLSIISVEGVSKRTLVMGLTLPIIVLGIPVIDALVAICRRTLLGRSPMSPDRGHLHHLLLRSGFSQRNIALIFYGITLLLGLSTAILTFAKNWIVAVAFIVFLAAAGAGYRLFGYRFGPFLKRHHNWRNEAKRTVILLDEMNKSDEAWEIFTALLKVMEIERAVLNSISGDVCTIKRTMDSGTSSTSELALPIYQGDAIVGELRISGGVNTPTASLMGAAQVLDPIVDRYGLLLLGMATGAVFAPPTRVRRGPLAPPTDRANPSPV